MTSTRDAAPTEVTTVGDTAGLDAAAVADGVERLADVLEASALDPSPTMAVALLTLACAYLQEEGVEQEQVERDLRWAWDLARVVAEGPPEGLPS